MRFGNTARRDRAGRVAAFALALAMLATAAFMGGGILSQSALAESTATDPSPAIRVARDTVNSVVGIITNSQGWNRSNGVQNTMVAQGSGVVIAEGATIRDGCRWAVRMAAEQVSQMGLRPINRQFGQDFLLSRDLTCHRDGEYSGGISPSATFTALPSNVSADWAADRGR